MRLAKLAAVAAVCTQLGGCWFVFIPGSLIQAAADAVTGADGDHCVTSSVAVGDTLGLPDGRRGVVRSLSGTSVKCRDSLRPIRARIDPYQ